MTAESRETVVVGGGPAGTATAIALRQRGHDVLLLDAARFPRDKPCGESVSPGAWPALESLDLAAAVRALSPQPIRGMALTSPDGTGFRGTYPEGSAEGFGVRRILLDATLLGCARAAGVEVREGVRVEKLLLSADGVAGVRCADERAIRSRIVIGADGRRGRVARSLGLLREHRSLRKFAVRGHWDGVEGLAAYGEMHVGGGGYCGVAPLAPARANVTFVLDQRELAAAAGRLEIFYRQTLSRWPHLAERLASARLLEPPCAIGPLALDCRRAYAAGVLLVGDSAGFYDPFTGEGISLALRSALMAAAVASRALAAGRASSADLAEYGRARDCLTRDKFRFNRLLQRVIAWPGLADALARRLARRPELADRLVAIAGDLTQGGPALDLGLVWDLVRA